LDGSANSAAWAAQFDNSGATGMQAPRPAPMDLQRVADVPIYATDSTVRRAASLQASADARELLVGLPTTLWRQLKLQPGAKVLVAQGETAVVLHAQEDTTLAEGAVRLAAGHPSTAGLGAMFGAITVESVKGA
jgi:NADH-quinone oxidoreductase subunit G